jgi:hypothetical protein
MSSDATRTYLWIVDWDDRFIHPRVVNVHRFVVAEPQIDSFEAHMRDEQIPAQGNVLTRAGSVVRQVLLRERRAGEGPTGFNASEEDVSEELRALCQQISISNFVEVHSWPQPDTPEENR